MPTTLAGRPVADLDTPALLVDLDAMDRNIARIAGELAARGVAWRPHAKGHKCPAIAHRQLAAGAVGVTCAKLGEAEVFAAAGVRDILIANQIVGPIKTRRLAALVASSGADVAVAVDDPANVAELDAAARTRCVRLRVLIEVDVGMERCGVAPGEPVVALARDVAARPGLRFAGLMAWEGHAMSLADPDDRRRAVEAAVALLAASATACRDAGLPVEVVSCGGTGTYLTTGRLPGVTEVQAGGGTLGDALYRELGVPVEPALTLLTQVVSRPTPDRLIVDAGRKSIDPTARPPTPRRLDGVVDITFSAEHGRIRLARPSAIPRVGDRLELEVGYHDQAVHLHDTLYPVRAGVVLAAWSVAARGRLQ
jgi:D-serine deaminase-like pyridoxal phosphate-dependent protein